MSSRGPSPGPRWTRSCPAMLPPHSTTTFRDLDDPRVERTRLHPLINIAFIAVRGVLPGANSCAAIREFGIDRRTWPARFLDPGNGIPSEDTVRRVPTRLDPA